MGRSTLRTANPVSLLALTVLALLAIATSAQQRATAPPPPLPVYDIVAIHPQTAFDANLTFRFRPGNFAATNVTLKQLISFAYGIRDDQISGLPAWATSNHFDVTAKVSDFDLKSYKKLTRDQLAAMLRPILIDRFHVKVHTEIKALGVFYLVLAKGGPKFKIPPDPADPDHPAPNEGISVNNNSLTATAIPLSSFSKALADQLDHTVIDKTGLTGDYNLKLKWSSDEDRNNAADNGAADRPPDLFTALQEQLGLKLEATKGPVDLLVVDHAEQPTPN